MSDGANLLAVVVVTLIWAYMMFSKNPEIKKNRNRTQKIIYTVFYAFVLWIINQGVFFGV